MRILFVGGTGLISSAVSPLVIERGHHRTSVRRGGSPTAAPRESADVIVGDTRDAGACAKAGRLR